MASSHLHTLTGRLVTLRPADETELSQLAEALAADANASPWLGTDPSVILTWFRGDGVSAFVVDSQGTALGVITFEEELDPDYHAANIDIGLLSGATGRGVGPDALATLVEYLFTVRGHHRVTIDPAVANTRAIRAYERVGFKPVGVMREYERGSDDQWHDNLLMDLLKRELMPTSGS
ncbi:MAG: GNAT family protein [Coriobacteriia bacterium]|nr:GNAT family protein [Coriobacteriia bacterium]